MSEVERRDVALSSDSATLPLADSDAKIEEASLSLIAYHVIPELDMPLVPASSARDWMDTTASRFANRCLPLLIANRMGWFILTSHSVRVTWTGGDSCGDVAVEYLDGTAPYSAISNFGHGIVTWRIPYLFRTPPGWNLYVRGPSNLPKDGACALDGVVETDWAIATFTMNWKLTRPWAPILFQAGQPICMIFPQRRGEIERFIPQRRRLQTEPKLQESYHMWRDGRSRFNMESSTRTHPPPNKAGSETTSAGADPAISRLPITN